MSPLKSVLDAISVVLGVLKQAKDLLPDGPKKEATEKAIANAETQIKIAEAQAADALGYQICRCTWPPQIMLTDGDPRRFRCGKCGHVEDYSRPISLD